MLKAKFCSFAVACSIGLVCLNPLNAYAAETNTESVTLSEKDKDQKDRNTAYEDAIKAAEKWETLTAKQKAEVYTLLENDMKAEFKLMDKLVEFGMINKDDADAHKIRMMERLNKLKASGEFPLYRQKNKQKQ
jgi:ribosomal protein S20